MGAQKTKGQKAAIAFHRERLFMNNGSVMTPVFVEKRPNPENPRKTNYYGANGVFICEVNEDHVTLRAAMNLPVTVQKVPSGPQPGAPLVDAQTYPAGEVLVSGYKF